MGTENSFPVKKINNIRLLWSLPFYFSDFDCHIFSICNPKFLNKSLGLTLAWPLLASLPKDASTTMIRFGFQTGQLMTTVPCLNLMQSSRGHWSWPRKRSSRRGSHRAKPPGGGRWLLMRSYRACQQLLKSGAVSSAYSVCQLPPAAQDSRAFYGLGCSHSAFTTSSALAWHHLHELTLSSTKNMRLKNIYIWSTPLISITSFELWRKNCTWTKNYKQLLVNVICISSITKVHNMFEISECAKYHFVFELLSPANCS